MLAAALGALAPHEAGPSSSSLLPADPAAFLRALNEGSLHSNATQEPPESVAALRKGLDEKAAACFDLLTRFHGKPFDFDQRFSLVVLSSGVMWCPAAKVASTTVLKLLSPDDTCKRGVACRHKNMKTNHRTSADLSLSEKRAWCEKKHLTFTMVRDPFDRLASAYLDSMADERLEPQTNRASAGTDETLHTWSAEIVFPEQGNISAKGWGCKEARSRLSKVAQFPTFTQFIEVLVQMAPEEHDVHTWPFSYRCGTDRHHSTPSQRNTYTMLCAGSMECSWHEADPTRACSGTTTTCWVASRTSTKT
jgi:hypothetical protein